MAAPGAVRVKIWIHSHVFYPSIGGIEEVGRLLAEAFHRAGHLVQVTTETPENDDASEALPFPVIRRPGPRQLLSLVRWAAIVFHNNISLQAAWPLLCRRGRWVIGHHTWIRRPAGGLEWQDKLKLFLLRFATNVTVSEALAKSLPVRARVIPNPYDHETFHTLDGDGRSGQLIFVGRLVSDKGADVLLQALDLLRSRQMMPSLTLVGDGPERERLRALASELGLKSQVLFTGAKRGPELAQLLRAHRILVVPSRWEEPFGLVALEGIACGCVVVGSAGGGLKEAIGPCGLTFPNGDAMGLADALGRLLQDPAQVSRLRRAATNHLHRHLPEKVGQEYLELFTEKLSCS